MVEVASVAVRVYAVHTYLKSAKIKSKATVQEGIEGRVVYPRSSQSRDDVSDHRLSRMCPKNDQSCMDPAHSNLPLQSGSCYQRLEDHVHYLSSTRAQLRSKKPARMGMHQVTFYKAERKAFSQRTGRSNETLKAPCMPRYVHGQEGLKSSNIESSVVTSE